MTTLNKAHGVNSHTVIPSYLQAPHPWIQPMADQKYLKKKNSRKLIPKQYGITTIYVAFTLC